MFEQLSDNARAIVYATLIHLAMITMLAINIRWSAPDASVPVEIIEAMIIDSAPASRAEIEATAAAVAQVEREAREAEAAKKRAAELAAKQKAAEIAAREKAAEEMRKKKASAAAAKRRRAEAERQMREQMAAEEAERNKGQRSAAMDRELARYKLMIRQKVTQNWLAPAGARGRSCTVHVRLVAGGEVLSARVTRSSGDAIFDRSVENAVFKASPLPVPEDAALFARMREIEFRFTPK